MKNIYVEQITYTAINSFIKDIKIHLFNLINDITAFRFFFFLSGILIFFSSAKGLTAQDSERLPVVWNVSFEGNENFSNMVLREIIATESPGFLQKLFGRTGDYGFNELDVRRDRVRIMRYYERRGYQNVQVDYEIIDRRKNWQKEVIFQINEGNPVRIRTSVIEFEADPATVKEIRETSEFERAAEKHDYQVGNRYQTLRRADVEGRFLNLMEELGYAWPEVDVKAEVDTLRNEADITIRAVPNTRTYFEDIQVDGEISVPERILLRETEITKGDRYSRSKLQEAQRQIFNHHLYRFATITVPEQPQDSTLNIILRVREHPKRSIQTMIGFGREELLRGQLSWQNRNVNGRGHRFGTSGRASFIEQRLSADYLFPYVFNSRSSNVVTVFGQHKLEPSFELFRTGINNSLIYQISRSKTASATYEFSINEELSRNLETTLPDTMINYNVSSLSLSGYYSQGLTREPRGWLVQPFVEFSGTFGESSFSFQKVLLDLRRYTQISNSLTFAARINTGAIFYDQARQLPSNIRLFTGGTNSVRGWNRQNLGPSRASFDEDGEFESFVPVGGRALFSFNIELRQQLTGVIPNLGLAAFLDGGQVWQDLDRLDERPVQYGAGGGIRYQSPIGPVRVDVGYKLNPTEEDLNIYEGRDYGSALSRIGIHFSIGQAF